MFKRLGTTSFAKTDMRITRQIMQRPVAQLAATIHRRAQDWIERWQTAFAKMAEEYEQIAEIIEHRRREQENKQGHYSKARTCGSGGTDAGSARG
jgi:hypothetical protein